MTWLCALETNRDLDKVCDQSAGMETRVLTTDRDLESGWVMVKLLAGFCVRSELGAG